MTLTVLMLLVAGSGAACQALRTWTVSPPEGGGPRRVSALGIDATLRGYLPLVAAAAVGAGALTLIVAGRLVPAAVAACGVLAGLVWPAVRTDRRTQSRVRAQLPQLADHLADAVAAGLSLTQSLRSAAESIGDPLGAELRRTVRAIDLGDRADDALDDMSARVHDPAFAVMMDTIAVQRKSGGDLGGSLARIARGLGEREKLSRELQTATAQARMTGGLVAALPLAAGVALELARPGSIASLLAGPGMVLLAGSLALQVAGLVVIRRVSRVVL